MESDQQIIAERYRLIRRIGAGGMADVFLAHDTRLDRQVAVKVLHRSHGQDATALERFKREAHAAASLNHPGIVSVYDWGETDETPFIVMAYIPGDSLKEVLRRRRWLPQAEVLEIARQVAGALADAHAHGIVHRDIKPHNILVRPDGQVCVTDFGIARILDQTSVTTGNVVVGSALYLSPEQAQGHEVDARTDVYSLGVVMFELLTGRAPFSGESLPSLALQHLTQTPAAPSALRPGIAPDVDAVVLTALAKDPNERYQSAAEMGVAIDMALAQAMEAADQSIAIPSPPLRHTPPDLATTMSVGGVVAGKPWLARNRERMTRRWPLTLGLAGLLFTGLLGLFASATGFWSGVPPSRASRIVASPTESVTAGPKQLHQPLSGSTPFATPTPAPSPTITTTPSGTPSATADSTQSAQPQTTPSSTPVPATVTPAPSVVPSTPTPAATTIATPSVVPTTTPSTPTSAPTPPSSSPTPAPTPPPPSPTPSSTASPPTPTPVPTAAATP